MELLSEAQCNCWGQADALFAVCMARAGRGEKAGFVAAKQAAKQPSSCILFQVVELEKGELPSVHAFVALKLAGGPFRICQAMQSQNRKMEHVKSFQDNDFLHHFSSLQQAVGRRKKMAYAELRSIEVFCGDLSDCFQDDSMVSMKIMSVGW